MQAGLIAAIVSIVWTLATYWLTYAHGSFTPEQVRTKFPRHSVMLPAQYHWGIGDDLFLWTVAVAYIVNSHASEWSWMQIGILFAIGMVLSGLMHWLYVQTPFPDPLAWKEEGITPAGWSHVFYMGAGFALVGLFYFCSDTAPRELAIVSLLLAVHVAIGNHVLVGFLNKVVWRYEWMPEFLRTPNPWVTIGATCLILAVFSWWSVH